jgi:hypothetical protein
MSTGRPVRLVKTFLGFMETEGPPLNPVRSQLDPGHTITYAKVSREVSDQVLVCVSPAHLILLDLIVLIIFFLEE